MPVWKYFVWVGGVLLALLFVADFYIPKQPEQASTQHTYNIPIASSARPGPEAITFSGETRNFGAPPPMTVVDFSAQPIAASRSPGPQALQAHAELTVAPSATQSPTPARQKTAKRKRQREPADHDPASFPDAWRNGPTGLAFAKPPFW
jgi:hypothetical protein